ncbi:MAG: glutathione S-transferase family protein [Candidatus Binatia bacterium]|nr:glutathione S-transferase family protein [Candidatus Binatia bacterium]
MRLYDYLPSGNGYKIRLLLTQLDVPFERIELDIVDGATRTDAYLEKNPNGRIPLLETDEGVHLAESNAILFFLADGTPFLPDRSLDRARVLQWMFFEQYNHEPNIATSRHWIQHLELTDERRARLEEKYRLGHEALAVMETHLAKNDFFVGRRYTIADIALFAYTHVAPEGGFELDPYPNIQGWITRVADQPGHIPITQG